MKILLLGVGMQGKAAAHDLAHSDDVDEVVAADLRPRMVRRWVEEKGLGNRVRAAEVDAADPDALDDLMGEDVDAVVDLLPPSFVVPVARAAIRNRVHLVNTMHVTPELAELAADAEERGVTILPELGMDPGIDLVLLGEAAGHFRDPSEILSYGSGIPAPEAADNPLNYKVSWTFEGVLRSYHRPARLIRDGRVVEIPEDELFRPEHVHRLDIAGLGPLEAYPNGDALDYVSQLGIDRHRLERAGRYTLRWPGHCAFWDPAARLGLLDDEPVEVHGEPVDRKAFLAAALAPALQYEEGEADLAILRVEVAGAADDGARRLTYQVVDRMDPETGISAMGRLVGFTASIGAQMIARGAIRGPGLLTPLRDVPYRPFVRRLGQRGIEIVAWEGP